ncbi:hypothetical protein DV735_g5827, partial [Chaetothyriales sp. CBS 134920]
LQSSLYQQIDLDKITTLNEAHAGSGRAIVAKPWTERLLPSPPSAELESDVDEQLLMHIPLTGSCKLYSIVLRASDTGSAPLTLKLFRNREDVDFATAAQLTPTQTLSLPRSNDVAEIALNRAQWNGTTSVDLFFEDNHSRGDEDVTRVGYIAFKGDFVPLNREAVQVVYEAAPNPADHKVIQGLRGGGVNESMSGR